MSSTQAGLLDEENNVGIVYVLTRDAEDLDPGLGGPSRIAFGKGAINCESRQLFVWSMEMREGDERTRGRQPAGLAGVRAIRAWLASGTETRAGRAPRLRTYKSWCRSPNSCQR